LFAEYEFWVIAWCFFAIAFGGLIKGALGIGTPLLTVPMMAMVLPPQMAIAIMAIPIVGANLWQFYQADRSKAVVRRFWPAFIGILIGILVGVKILSIIDESTLLIVVGVAVIAFAILQGSSYRLHLSESLVTPVGGIFGLASGVIGGISSFFGPMLVVYLISIRDLTKNQFVSSISFLYVSAVIPWAVTLYLYGILDQKMLIYSTAATLPVTLGIVVGQMIRGRIGEDIFKILIIGILLMSGTSMLWRAFQ
jgi:uncharacterized membrane protein YfcA